jgi:hypothetical protein
MLANEAKPHDWLAERVVGTLGKHDLLANAPS